MACKPPHVHLVNDGPCGWPVQWLVPLPVVRAGVHHSTLHCAGNVVPCATGGTSAVAFWEHDRTRIWVKQELRWGEPVTETRIEWSVNRVAVNLAGFDSGDKVVPIVIGPIVYGIESNLACRSGIILPVEEQQFDAGGRTRVDAEVDTTCYHRRTQGMTPTSLDG